MDVLRRNNVRVAGAAAGRPMVLAHGFGCDQRMWRHVVPHFADDHRIVLVDHVGAGGSDLSAYDPAPTWSNSTMRWSSAKCGTT